MCGIVGGLYFTESTAIENVLETIKHRGPDKRKIVKLGGHIFGHARLSIQDLSELGDQPMISKCGRFLIVFNGEIYNTKILIEESPAIKTKLVGTSDTEVLLSTWLIIPLSCQLSIAK